MGLAMACVAENGMEKRVARASYRADGGGGPS